MSIGEKATNNKFKQNKAQYDLDKQNVKISALSSGNVSKYEVLTGKDVLFARKSSYNKKICILVFSQTIKSTN